MENTLHYNSLLLQLCYLHSNNRGLASAEQLLINNTTGERGGSQGEGVEVLCLSRSGMKQNTIWTGWHFRPAKSIPSLQTSTTEVSALSVSASYLYRYKTGAAFSSSFLSEAIWTHRAHEDMQQLPYESGCSAADESHIDRAESDSCSWILPTADSCSVPSHTFLSSESENLLYFSHL